MSEIEAGKRITIEGNDGTGKSTVADMLAWQVQRNGFLTLRTDEPNSPVDQYGNILLPHIAALRTEIKDGSQTHNPYSDLGMFNTSRFLSWTRVSKPYIKEGYWEIKARDSDSSGAYQGSGDQLGIDTVFKVVKDFMGDEEYFKPDFKTTLVFEDEAERLMRIASRGPIEKPDTFEKRGADYQDRVNQGYFEIATRFQRDITEIRSSQPREEIADIVFQKAMGVIGVILVKHDWNEYFELQKEKALREEQA